MVLGGDMRKLLAVIVGVMGAAVAGSLVGWAVTHDSNGEWGGAIAASLLFLSWALWPRY